MLSVFNLSIFFANRCLFDNVNFTIDQDNRIGLIGRNGSGKTTLLKILNGELTPDDGKIIKSNDYKVGYLPQEGNITSSLSVIEEAKLALEEIIELEKKIEFLTNEISIRNDYDTKEYSNLIHTLSDSNHRYEILGGHYYIAHIEKILTGLGFSREDLNRKVNEFSGGWRMRLALAKILLSAPDCILLDEPTNHLDIESIIWLENFLKKYYGAVIIVSHDKRFLDSVTNRTIEISNSKIIDFPLPYSKYLIQRKEQRENQIKAFKNQQKQIERTEKYIETYRYKANLASRVQSKIKQLDKIDKIEIEDLDNSSIIIKFPPSPQSGIISIELNNITKYYGEKLILKDINLTLERGEKVALVGKNGEGKTTLTKIMTNETDYEGKCKLGHNINIGYFSQHQADLLDKNSTVFQIIDNAATGEMRLKVRSILGAFLFSNDTVEKKVSVLSGGEKSRLALAKLLLQPHNFLILDEPTNHLDIKSKEILKKALIDYEGTLILVSHDRDFLEDITNKTIYFGNKNIKIYDGDINYFLEKLELEHLNEIELNRKVEAKQETTKSDKIKFEEQKQFNRKKNSIKKEINESEEKINTYETRIDEINILFSDPAIIENINELTNLQNEYDELNKNLNEELINWEDLNNKFEKFIEN